MAEPGLPESERRPVPPRKSSHGILKRLVSRKAGFWLVVASLSVLLGIFIFAIGLSLVRDPGSWNVNRLLFSFAFVFPLAAALFLLLWYGRSLGGAVAGRARAEDSFRTVASTMGDGIVTIDDHSRIQFVNDAVGRIFGYTGEELLGKELTILMPERFHAKHRAGIQRYTSTGRRSLGWESIQFQGRHKDGREIPLEISIGEHLVGGERVLTGIVRDITERKRAEQAHGETQRRLAAIVEGSEDAIYIKDLAGTISSWNAGAERTYGYTAAEAIGQSVSILFPPEKIGELTQALNRLRRGEKIEFPETVRVRKDARKIIVSSRISPIRDSGGLLVGGSTIARDITERRQAEQALAESEAKFRSLIESAPDGIFVVDATATILDMNPAGEKLIDRPRTEAVGHQLTEFILPERTLLFLRYVQERIAGASSEDLYEGVWLGPGGRRLYVQLTSQVVPKPEVSLVVFVRDVTEQQDMQRKLVESERWASMGRLASFVAHEINTPLTNISLLTASVARRVADPDAQERLKKIAVQGKIAASITQELLRFARPGAIIPVDTDLKELVEEAVEQADAFRKPTTEIRTELGTEPVMCAVDPLRIHEVLVNLLKNAYEATPSGWVQVLLEDRGPFVTVTVADTGSGIPPEIQSRLFEPFFTTKKKGEGTGLGLAISRNFVVSHGGDITVTSYVGRGSTFTVLLPRQTVEAPPAEAAPVD
jgi:PAS domain S-box-containing protein